MPTNLPSLVPSYFIITLLPHDSLGCSPPLSYTQNIDQFDDIGPCVIMASPGMMQSGLSRQLFEAWCTDKRNGVIIAGYCVEGTLAKVREKKSNFVIDTCQFIQS